MRGCAAVYHVTKDGWKKERGVDVGGLHWKYYPNAEQHACHGAPPIPVAEATA